MPSRSVTSVGGTVGSSPETAWDGSSGGFSNYYSAPSYQSSAVKGYLSKLALSPAAISTAGRFNSSGRGFPDVSAKADDFRVWESSIASIWGTSASAPTFASIVALINDRLAGAGKAPMGFLNPWLYSKGTSGFTDITAGNNSVECNGKSGGFEAVEGWDPVRVSRPLGLQRTRASLTTLTPCRVRSLVSELPTSTNCLLSLVCERYLPTCFRHARLGLLTFFAFSFAMPTDCILYSMDLGATVVVMRAFAEFAIVASIPGITMVAWSYRCRWPHRYRIWRIYLFRVLFLHIQFVSL